jgi:surface antigen
MISASKRLVFGACVVLPLLAVAGTASAQFRYLSPDGPRMTREDLDRQRAAAQSLLDKEPPPVGASASWSNPKSGARGRVTMVNARDARGRSPCRRMRYEVSTRGAAGPADMTFTVCRMPDGAWKTAE